MFNNSEEVLKYISDEKVEFVDIRFCDLPGVMKHLTVPADRRSTRTSSTAASPSTARPIRGFQAIHESDMTLLPDLATARLDPFRKHKTLTCNFFVHDPLTCSPTPATRATSPARPRSTWPAPASPTPASSAPRPSSTSSTTSASSTSPNESVLPHRLRRGLVEHRPRGGGRQPRLQGPRSRAATSRCRRYDHYADLRDDMAANLINVGFEVERGHHEVGTAGQAEINYRFNTLLHSADDLMLFKYIIKNTAWARRQDRHLHAQAAVRRQRLGHARPPVAVEGRQAAVLRRGRLRRPVRHGPLLHRRPAAPRAVAAGVHQPDGELLPPPGARLRGAGQPGLLGPQPLGLHPHPADRHQRQGQAPRVPLPRPVGATRTWRSPR